MTRTNQHQNLHKHQRKVMFLYNNVYTHVDLHLQLEKIFYQLPGSAEGKSRCRLHRWVGIETQKDDVHFLTFNFNLCDFCYRLFYSDVGIVKTEDSIYTTYKRFKSHKITKFCTFVWYTFLHKTYATISFPMGKKLQ